MFWCFSCLDYLFCICLTWRFLLFIFKYFVSQLFGISYGFGILLEHNTVDGRYILCLCKMHPAEKKADFHHLCQWHGKLKLFMTEKTWRSHCFYNAQIILELLYILQVLSYQLLAAACSTASITNLLLHADKSYCPENLCSRYQLSTAMAFLAWFLLSASFLFNLWRFPSL